MITSFPVKIKDCKLFIEDFVRFKQKYKQIILEQLLTAEDVNFVNPALSNALPKVVNSAIEQCLLDDQKIIIQDENVLMIFICENGQRAVSVSGLDSMILDKATLDWLEDIYSQIHERMVGVKEQLVDVETGFLNLYSLHQTLKIRDGGRNTYLIEVPQTRIGSRYIYSHLQAVTNALSTYVQNPSYLYYLGNAVFCLCLPRADKNLEYAEALVAFLKREGFKKVHIGIGDCLKEDVEQLKAGQGILDQAWTAWQEAVIRGPYSFCSYSTLLNPELHPLAMPAQLLKRRVSRAVRLMDKFSLVLFKNDNDNRERFLKTVEVHCTGYKLFNWNEDVVVLLPESGGEEASRFAVNVMNSFQEKESSVSAGVANFPFRTYKKSETLMLARKALLHTAFYGDGTVTTFDALSCNVSGDIYYNEGDFNKAVNEYKQGLGCDPDDVNLLNSLGVTYAMMGRRDSIPCFEKVLQQEPANFMALYNLGLSHLAYENLVNAVECFEKSLASIDADDGQPFTVKSDLQLQLGLLCSKLEMAERAIELLEPFTEDQKFSCKHNILFYLGKSNFDAGKRKNAIRWLQKAAAAHCFEDQTLSLLGYLYYLEGQGHEVALSLCKKSVSLNPFDHQLQLRLAEVLASCNEFDEALLLASQSIRKKKYNKQAKIIIEQIRLAKKEQQDKRT